MPPPPTRRAFLPSALELCYPEKVVKRAEIKPPIKSWLSLAQVMINGLCSLTQRRKGSRERAADGSFQLITEAQQHVFRRAGTSVCSCGPATGTGGAITALRDESGAPVGES